MTPFSQKMVTLGEYFHVFSNMYVSSPSQPQSYHDLPPSPADGPRPNGGSGAPPLPGAHHHHRGVGGGTLKMSTPPLGGGPAVTDAYIYIYIYIHSLLAIPYWLFPIGYTLLAIP